MAGSVRRPGKQNVTHPIAGADMILYGQLHCGFNLAGLIIPVEHENGNEILDPFGFALGTAKTFQKKMQGLRPALSPLPDGSGAVESHGPLLNQFKIMIRIETPFVVAVRPLVRGHLLRADENLHPIHMEQHLHPEPRITARHGISVLVHNDCGVLVGPAVGCLHIAEGISGRARRCAFSSSYNSFTVSIPPGHLVIPVGDALPENLLVELLQAPGLRNRNHVIAPCKADQPLNPALFVAAVGIAETGFKTVIRLELARILPAPCDPSLAIPSVPRLSGCHRSGQEKSPPKKENA